MKSRYKYKTENFNNIDDAINNKRKDNEDNIVSDTYYKLIYNLVCQDKRSVFIESCHNYILGEDASYIELVKVPDQGSMPIYFHKNIKDTLHEQYHENNLYKKFQNKKNFNRKYKKRVESGYFKGWYLIIRIEDFGTYFRVILTKNKSIFSCNII